MKTPLLFALLLLIAPLPLSAQVKWQNDSVTIIGKVVNYSPNDPKTIRFFFRNDLTNRNLQNIYTAEIDTSNNFRLKEPLLYPLDFTVIYKNTDTLLCAPGDSLFLEVDNGSIRVTKGVRKKDNDLLKSFMQGLSGSSFNHDNRNKALTQKLPNEFKVYITQREKEYRAYWDQFKKKNKTTAFFDAWVEDYLKYLYLSDLMIYPSCYARELKIKEDSLQLPHDYYAELKKLNFNECQIFSSKHADFLDGYYHLAIGYPRDSVSKAYNYFRKNEIVAGAQVLLRLILQNTSGFTQNLALTKFYLDAIEGRQLKEFEALYDSTLITDPYFKNFLAAEHEKLKKYMANQLTENANLREIKSTIVKGIIDTLTHKYAGKIIYMDFWAPWCSPCMGEMPFSKKLQEDFKNKDVVFLYLGNRCTEASWKATIANEELIGEHILLTDDQYAVLVDKLGITGIPHYVLIDKKGNIVSKDAPRPSQKTAVTKSLNDLLWINQ